MPDPSAVLSRRLILRPLLLSLIPLFLALLVIDGPIRGRVEREETRRVEEHARLVAALLRGVERIPSDLPVEWLDTPQHRLVLTDAHGRPVFDSDDPRIVATGSWHGPEPGIPIWWKTGVRSDPATGPPHVRAQVLWGEGERAGGLIVFRSLERMDARFAWAQLGVAGLWGLFVISLLIMGWRTLRDLRADQRALARALEAIPGSAGGLEPEGTALLDLDRAIRASARRTQVAIDKLSGDLREREAVLQGMLEGVVAVNEDREVVLINPSAERMLHLPSDTSRGRRITELIRSGRFQALVEEILETETSGELEFSLRDGSRHLRVLGDVLRRSGGGVRGAVLVMGDVTDLRRLERIRRDFVANVSHELKTPITAIQGYVETLLDEQESAEARRRFLRIIDGNVRRMHRILEDLLSLSRVELAGEEIEMLDFPVREMVERVINESRREAHRRRTRVALEVAPQVGTMRGNAALLERAIGNLIDNALKYGPGESVVQVGVALEGKRVRFDVRDRGPGIAAHHLPRLFERFYRVDKGRSRELGGTGLGLAIVKHIALAHGGTVEVTSEVGEGSTFTILIPRRVDQPAVGGGPDGSGA
ncbi:MAG: PAS domain-containing protein [Candidatus Eisenbacteria bacterium]|nr:PAS domain-containing protein [Candidatus Latescibacterota bacterium]MBD3302404.1 PAS domain-containing protein [Candidatus Eisenbacteria bacterium]